MILASLCRPGEAASIRAEDVITLNGERVWRVAEPKNGKDFLIPLEVTGFKDIRPHDLRRTGRTHASGLRIRDEVGEALLNHAKEGITGTYNLYSYWPERRDALRLWHQKLEALRARQEKEAA